MSVHFSSAGFADGARTALPLAVGAALFASALGVLAAAKGLNVWASRCSCACSACSGPAAPRWLPFTVTVVATVALAALLPGKWNVLLGAFAGALVATFSPSHERAS